MITPLPGLSTLKPASASRPFPGISAEVVDESGEALPHGTDQTGILVITKPWPSMLRTLWRDDARYQSVYWSKFEGKGYYFPGDGARRDEEGDYWLLGRVDDIMLVAGHNISTMEVESALVDHPAVAEAAVIGRTHEIKGQAIAAFVTLKDGIGGTSELAGQLKDHVAKKIGAISRPDDILFSCRASEDPQRKNHAPPAPRHRRRPRPWRYVNPRGPNRRRRPERKVRRRKLTFKLNLYG